MTRSTFVCFRKTCFAVHKGSLETEGLECECPHLDPFGCVLVRDPWSAIACHLSLAQAVEHFTANYRRSCTRRLVRQKL